VNEVYAGHPVLVRADRANLIKSCVVQIYLAVGQARRQQIQLIAASQAMDGTAQAQHFALSNLREQIVDPDRFVLAARDELALREHCTVYVVAVIPE